MNQGQHGALQPHGSASRRMKGGVTVGQQIIFVNVIPRSRKFEILSFDEKERVLKVRLKSPPEGGKANKELLTKLEKIMGYGVSISRGFQSRKKILIVNCPDKEFTVALNRIRAYVKERH